jgi:hypothetical protein
VEVVDHAAEEGLLLLRQRPSGGQGLAPRTLGDRHHPLDAKSLLAAPAGRGAPDEHDPQLQADIQALYDAGTIRLMAGGDASGGSFDEAMPAPLD